MADIVKQNYPALNAAWKTLAKMQDVWTTGTGNFLIHVLVDHFGRDDAEEIALYWHEAGRDDIAARIKNIIHQGDEKRT